MELLILLMAAFLMIHQLEFVRLKRRLMAVEATKAAVDVLAEQVTEMSGDFYGPSAE